VTSHITIDQNHNAQTMKLSDITENIKNHGKMISWYVTLIIMMFLYDMILLKMFREGSVICDVTFSIEFLV
jgi:hypothetical protein